MSVDERIVVNAVMYAQSGNIYCSSEFQKHERIM